MLDGLLVSRFGRCGTCSGLFFMEKCGFANGGLPSCIFILRPLLQLALLASECSQYTTDALIYPAQQEGHSDPDVSRGVGSILGQGGAASWKRALHLYHFIFNYSFDNKNKIDALKYLKI